jgi:hypothetical protein
MMDKRRHIKKYFKPFPKWAVGMIIIGLPLLALYGLGLVLIGIGILGLVDGSKKPSDAQMDSWLEEDLNMLHGKALSKTGTDASELVGEPVMVTGPRVWNVADAHIAFNRGKDNVCRFTPAAVTVLNFTANRLISYSCVLDLTTGNALNESTDEYFYQDVVSVSTKTKSQSIPVPGKETVQLTEAETFELTTSGGTSIEVVLRDPSLIKMAGGGDIPTTRAEKAIQSVRKMLREKKGTAA